MKAWLPGVIVFALAALPVGAQTAGGSAPTHDQVSKVTSYLFVQNASSGSFKDGRLTLEAVYPFASAVGRSAGRPAASRAGDGS